MRNFKGLTACLALLLAPQTSFGSQEAPVILLLETMRVPTVQQWTDAFVGALRDLDANSKQTTRILRFNAEGNRATAARIIKETQATQPPDLIATVATLASQVAKEELGNTQIPIVFMGVADPVGAGLVARLGTPTGTNITGRVYSIDRESKLGLVGQFFESGRQLRIGYIHTDYPSSTAELRLLREAAKARGGFEFVAYEMSYVPGDAGTSKMLQGLETGLEAMVEAGVDYLWEPRGPLGEMPQATRLLLAQDKVPLLVSNSVFGVKGGALVNIATDARAMGVEAASIAYAVLQGAPIGSIPAVPPAKVRFSLNLDAAQRLGIAVPSDLIELAGEDLYFGVSSLMP